MFAIAIDTPHSIFKCMYLTDGTGGPRGFWASQEGLQTFTTAAEGRAFLRDECRYMKKWMRDEAIVVDLDNEPQDPYQVRIR